MILTLASPTTHIDAAYARSRLLRHALRATLSDHQVIAVLHSPHALERGRLANLFDDELLERRRRGVPEERDLRRRAHVARARAERIVAEGGRAGHADDAPQHGLHGRHGRRVAQRDREVLAHSSNRRHLLPLLTVAYVVV